MAVKMLPQAVADAFVKQYYTILNKCPENAHKFYQESSLLGWPGPDDTVTPVTTLCGISDKIMSSDCKNCSVEIKTADAQDSLDGGVIVSVTGSLTGKNNVKKNFSQTFFLAKQEKGFFVLNDILRFFDVRGSITKTTDTATNTDGTNDQPASSMQSSVPCNISDSPTSSDTKAVVEHGKVKEAFDLSVSTDTVAKGAASIFSIASHEKVPSVVAPASNVKVDCQKITYASVVAKETPVTSPKTARVTSNFYNQPVASPTTKTSGPLVDGALKVSTPSSAASAPSSKVAPKSPAASNGPLNISVYAEARGIYIGGLPYDVTKQGIVEVVKKFGPVRRNSDTIQIRRHEDGFCCGFVEFESADAARRAVEAHHVWFGEKEAYITYKRSYANRGNDGRGRSPTKGGFQNFNFRGRENDEVFQNENRAGYNKGQARDPRRSSPSDKWSRDGRDRSK